MVGSEWKIEIEMLVLDVRIRPLTIHYSQLTTRYSLSHYFLIRYFLYTIRHSPFAPRKPRAKR
jgi:hypothetical protein